MYINLVDQNLSKVTFSDYAFYLNKLELILPTSSIEVVVKPFFPFFRRHLYKPRGCAERPHKQILNPDWKCKNFLGYDLWSNINNELLKDKALESSLVPKNTQFVIKVFLFIHFTPERSTWIWMYIATTPVSTHLLSNYLQNKIIQTIK